MANITNSRKSTQETAMVQFLEFTEEKKYFELYQKLKTENMQYVEDAQLAMMDYLGIGCDVYDPLKTIVDQGLLQIIPALPPMTVIATDDKGIENSENINHIIETWLRKDNSYIKVVDCVFDGLVKSEGYLYEYIAEEYSGEKLTYYGPRSRILPFSQVVYNGYTLEDSSVVCFWEFYTNDEFRSACQKLYNIDEETMICIFEHDGNGVPMPVDEQGNCIQQIDKVALVHIFDVALDKYIVYANGIWLNPTKDYQIRTNPYSHKQAPISSIVPFRNSRLKHGVSLAQRTSVLRDLFKNLQRKKLSVVEKLGGWDVISPEIIGDWSETKRIKDEHGVLVAEPNLVHHETPNMQNYQHLENESRNVLSQLADVAGWTFEALQTHRYENKSATLARAGAVTRTIEHIVRNILATFYARWMRQRLSNLQNMFDTDKQPLSIYGQTFQTMRADEYVGDSEYSDILYDMEIRADKNGVTTVIELELEDILGSVEIHPDVDTILASSKEQQAIMLKESLSVILQLPTKTGQPMFTQETMIELMSPLFPSLKLKEHTENLLGDDNELANIFEIPQGEIDALNTSIGTPTPGNSMPQEYNVGGGGMGGNIESMLPSE